MKIQIETLGCKVNSVEAESIAELFRERGHQIVKDNADFVIINTCCVTGEAEAKSRQAIRKALKNGAKVAVMGCYGQLAPKVIEDIGASIIIGTTNRQNIVEQVEEKFFRNQPTHPCCSKNFQDFQEFEELPHVPSKTRAFMKIQDGCNGVCTYCIIPKVRGKSRSRSLESIKQECETLSEYKEIVLTGINLGMYGADINSNLVEAIKNVLDNTDARIRLSSVEPTEITEELITILRDEPRLCKHLHIPVQSCSDAVLKMMHRPYTAKNFSDMVNRLMYEIPSITIGIDIILGFPGENDEMFEETFNCLQELPINHFHVFGYSIREGTIAATMEQVDPVVKKNRVAKVLALAAKKNLNYRRGLIGSEVEVLTEVCKDNYVEGHSGEYIKVYIAGDVPLNGIIKVKLTETYKDGMIGMINQDCGIKN